MTSTAIKFILHAYDISKAAGTPVFDPEVVFAIRELETLIQRSSGKKRDGAE